MKAFGLILLLIVAGCLTDNKDGSASGKTVYGEIVSADGIGVEGITVELNGVGISKSDTTSSDGSYKFKNIENGEYTIKFISDNYSFTNDEFDITKENEGYEVPRNIASQYLEVYFAIYSMLAHPSASGRTYFYALNATFTTPAGDKKISMPDTYHDYEWESPKYKFPSNEYIEFIVEKLNLLKWNRPEIVIFVNSEKWRSKRFQKGESVIRLYGIIH